MTSKLHIIRWGTSRQRKCPTEASYIVRDMHNLDTHSVAIQSYEFADRL